MKLAHDQWERSETLLKLRASSPKSALVKWLSTPHTNDSQARGLDCWRSSMLERPLGCGRMSLFGRNYMSSKVLTMLVESVIEQGQVVELTDEETQRFYREFESDVADQIEEMRAEKRRAYEEAKTITIR